MRAFHPTGILLLLTLAASPLIIHATAQAAPAQTAPAKVIFDTDIGDDIDDAYALALLLQSPDIQVVGITTAFGDTHLRARLVSHLLAETGHTGIPVFEGPSTPPRTSFTQTAWARQSPDRPYPDAIAFLRKTIRSHPGQITLLSVAPLTNVGALIAQDPAAFHQLKRVVIMGGSIDRGYGNPNPSHPDPEWNILCDIPASKALFASGVPIYVMPLDSTQIPLDLARQNTIFSRHTSLTDTLQELTREWSAGTHQTIPTLFDVVAAVYTLHPALCPMTPMRLQVDDKGFTRRVSGKPNASVCLTSNSQTFYDFVLPRLTLETVSNDGLSQGESSKVLNRLHM
jgi:inosine-uridine nucleoside N-ribohydrolase